MANKTTLTPAEHANTVQGMEYVDALSVFVRNEAAISTAAVLASKIVREPMSVKEIVVHMVDPGDGGANSDTFIDVKKNGVTILTAPIGIADEAAADTVSIALPASDALASLAVGDILTIESGADLGDVFVGLSVEVRAVKRFA
jgi:hypothetical protein